MSEEASAQGLLRPAYPRLAAALGAVTGATPAAVDAALGPNTASWFVAPDGRLVRRHRSGRGASRSNVAAAAPSGAAAWEALASREVIPAAWVDDPRRRFFAPRLVEADAMNALGLLSTDADAPLHRRVDAAAALAAQTGRTPYLAFTPAPLRQAACVAVGADAAGVAEAEALAREHARLAGLPDPELFLWHLLLPDALRLVRMSLSQDLAPTPAAREVRARGYALATWLDPRDPGSGYARLPPRVAMLLAPGVPWPVD